MTPEGYENAITQLREWAQYAHGNLVTERARGVWKGAIEDGDAAYFLGIEEPTDHDAGVCTLLLRASMRGANVVVEPILHASTRIVRGHALPVRSRNPFLGLPDEE